MEAIETETDFIDDIQAGQEKPGNMVNTITDIASMVGMFPFYVGLFQMFSLNEITKLNGIVTFIIGLLIIACSWYVPGLAAAYHIPGKKYIINYIFYGTRMVRRDMELIDDPLVIARLITNEDGEDEVIKTMEKEDEEFEAIMHGLDRDFLTDTEINKKIEEVLKKRAEKLKERKPNYVYILDSWKERWSRWRNKDDKPEKVPKIVWGDPRQQGTKRRE